MWDPDEEGCKAREPRWPNNSLNLKQDAYDNNFKEVRGPYADLYTEPIRAEVSMLVGGMKNGWLCIGDGYPLIRVAPLLFPNSVLLERAKNLI